MVNGLSEIKTATAVKKVNLCSGSRPTRGYINVDMCSEADVVLDMERDLLPFETASVDVVVCMSAINYFSYKRATEIIKDVYRILNPEGVARFGTQDLRVLAGKYVNRDNEFFFQKLPDGRDRFPGKTMADKLNEWFYGFRIGDKHGKYVYDFDSLRQLFVEAGFSHVEKKNYQESRIPEVAEIDNRPEQMFFLEAVKSGASGNAAVDGSDVGAMHKSFIELWENGQRERAWQLLLKVLELKPDDRMATFNCAQILKSLGRFKDLSKLYSNYLEVKPDDAEVCRLLDETQLELSRGKVKKDVIRQRRNALNKLNDCLNVVLPDQTHLAGCIEWLRHAQQVNPGDGVAAIYNIESQKWEVDYPETTGYIIPTFLSYYKLTGLEAYRGHAVSMGDWEVNIQAPEGGVGEPVGVYGLKPRIFNTAQVILGWSALCKETGREDYLEAAKRAGDWIVNTQDVDGKWTNSTYAGPKAYHIRVAWALLELYRLTGQEQYRVAAEKSVSWVLSRVHDNGWFDNNSVREEGKPWTHFIAYALMGLERVWTLNNCNFNRGKCESALCNAAVNIAKHYLQAKARAGNDKFVTLAGTFDSNWQSSDEWSCLTGSAQTEFFLRKMARHTNESGLLSAADILLDDLKRLHFLDDVDSADMLGGLPGAYPIGASYCSYGIPNWAVKFLADSLLQRVCRDEMVNYLG